jgi:glutamate/aspartate transport system substrate-binding protein
MIEHLSLARIRVGLAMWVGVAAFGLLCGSAHAQTASDMALTGTLAKVRDAGSVTSGYRESSIPFSYLAGKSEPIGYSIDLCRALVGAISEAVHKPLKIEWKPVTSDTRFDAVESGQVDLECGSTTSNLERQKRVAFSPTIFVAGTKLLVKSDSRARTFKDFRGKTIAVTKGTTNEKTLRDLSATFGLDIKLISGRDHGESFAALKQGAAEAFATDDVLLYGLIAQEKGGSSSYMVIGDFLSYDPYAVMFRKNDPQMTQVVHQTFVDLVSDGEVDRIYKRWFLGKLPGGNTLGMPMSAQLENLLRVLNRKTD